MIKVAFGSVPKDGGTFTFYRNQRPALLGHGVDLRCVTVGAREAGITEDAYLDEGCVLLAENEHDLKKKARIFAQWCEDEKVDVVVGVNSEAILSALPHLPEHIRVVSRCANAFDEGYRFATICQERYAAMVALTPRLERDLVADYGANPQLIRLIPNGINPEKFNEAASRARGAQDVLQLGFLGRLEHKQKGVLYLPEIVDHLRESGVDFKLRIAGKGIHRAQLEQEMASAIGDGQVEFVGQLTPNHIPEFLGSIDLYLFTSHFEGCPNALLEAMMAGCVPVSWVIDGITDFLIKDGETGCLIPMGDCSAFAEAIEKLSNNRGRVSQMSVNVSQEARVRYTNDCTADAYTAMFKRVLGQDPPAWKPLEWSQFQTNPLFALGWKSRIPAPIKKVLKKVLGR